APPERARGCKSARGRALAPPPRLLQRILLNGQPRPYAAQGPRIRASSLRKSTLLCAPSVQQPRQAVIPFDAARLVVDSVLLAALPGELLLGGPGLGPHGRIFDRDLVGKRLWPGARPPLDQVQVLARAKEIGLRTEVGDVDDERIALPMAARVAEPLTDRGRQVGAPVHDDVALPPLALIDVVEHRDAAGGLHDA